MSQCGEVTALLGHINLRVTNRDLSLCAQFDLIGICFVVPVLVCHKLWRLIAADGSKHAV